MRDATERETVKTKRDENTAAVAATTATTTTRARPSIVSVYVLFRGARQTPYLDFARRDGRSVGLTRTLSSKTRRCRIKDYF